MSDNQHSMDLVERKLRGVVHEVTMNVPWHQFERYLDCFCEALDDAEVEYDRAEVAQNPKVFELFTTACDRYVNYVTSDWDDVTDTAYSDGLNVYKKVIEDQKAKQRAKEEEEQRLAAEKLRAQIEAQQVLAVTPKNFNRAKAILIAAGLLKD